MLPGLQFLYVLSTALNQSMIFYPIVLRLFNPDLFGSRSGYDAEATFLVLTDNLLQATVYYLSTAILSDRSAIFITAQGPHVLLLLQQQKP